MEEGDGMEQEHVAQLKMLQSLFRVGLVEHDEYCRRRDSLLDSLLPLSKHAHSLPSGLNESESPAKKVTLVPEIFYKSNKRKAQSENRNLAEGMNSWKREPQFLEAMKPEEPPRKFSVISKVTSGETENVEEHQPLKTVCSSTKKTSPLKAKSAIPSRISTPSSIRSSSFSRLQIPISSEAKIKAAMIAKDLVVQEMDEPAQDYKNRLEAISTRLARAFTNVVPASERKSEDCMSDDSDGGSDERISTLMDVDFVQSIAKNGDSEQDHSSSSYIPTSSSGDNSMGNETVQGITSFPSRHNNTHILSVCNYPPDMEESHLRTMFSSFQGFVDVNALMSTEALIEFEDEKTAAIAMEGLQGFKWKELYSLSVEFARI